MVQPPNTPLIDASIMAATSSSVNVRQQPDTSTTILKSLRAGDAIRYHADPVSAGSYKIGSVTRNDWFALDTGWLACGVVVLTTSVLDTVLYKLTVPFVSQSGSTANRFNEDCGAAGCVMVARFCYVQKKLLDPVNLTVNDFANKTALANTDIGLTCDQLVMLLRGYGVNAQAKRSATLSDLSVSIHASFPPIVLVNYKYVDVAHPGDLGHFIVLFAVGQKGFWFHDPYLLGANQYITNDALSRAMADVTLYTSFPNQAVLAAP